MPYGDPNFRYWQAYFDTGEYLVGKWANSLELGCDCLGEIAYLDATVTDDTGQPRTIPNAICVHEEDFGILWKHTDIFNGSAQSRRQRRLVVSYFTTVGNYDYGFYWYFYLDGTIECEVKATGVLFTSAYPDADHPHSTEVAPGLAAPFHQHLFSARLDMTVDGLANAVEEVDVTGLPIGPDNPYGNAIVQTVTRLTRESQAGRCVDGSRGRTWRIVSNERANRFGRPTSYTLYPESAPVLLADPDSPLAQRARSRPTTCGLPGTTPTSATRPATSSPTRTPEERASLPSSPVTATSTAPTSSCGHVRPHPRPAPGGLAGHAGRPWPASCSSRPVSSTATPPWTCRPPPPTAPPTNQQ